MLTLIPASLCLAVPDAQPQKGLASRSRMPLCVPIWAIHLTPSLERAMISPMRKIVGTLGITFSIAAVLAGCGTASPQAKPVATAAATQAEPPVEVAVKKCSPFLTGDNGHSISLDGQGKDETANTTKASTEQIACILTELKAPDYVIAKMDSTRALDGMQNADWAGISASWTYHPDNGLDVILHDKV